MRSGGKAIPIDPMAKLSSAIQPSLFGLSQGRPWLKAVLHRGLLLLGTLFALTGCIATDGRRRPVDDELKLRGAVSPATRPAERGPSLEDRISEEDAVTLALRNNAAFQALLADLGLAWGDRVQAGMLPNPTLSMLLPTGPKALELTARLPLEFLWLRPKRVAMTELEYDRTVQRLTQSGLDLVRDVRLAFADLVLADRRIRLAGESLRLQEAIANIAEARLRAGDIGELEVTGAKVDVLRTQELLARLGLEKQISGERLRNLAGMVGRNWPERMEVPPPETVPLRSADEWVEDALNARPDLRAAELVITIAAKGVGLARAEVFTLGAGVNAKDVDRVFRAGPAVDFNLPLFNWNEGGKEMAKARLEKAMRNTAALRDRITLEVREAHLRLAQARGSAAQWTERILPPLEVAVRQAEQAFSAGDISYLQVLEHTRRLFEAQIQGAMVEADVHRAAAELERCVALRLEPSGTLSQKNAREKN
jgi:cobalt-zinc-cadmium efflux system outer membrane protein